MQPSYVLYFFLESGWNMRFNEKLQILRKEKKLSQEQLADMLDVTRQAVSKWESGTTYPEMDKLIIICKIFNCSLDDLTNDEITEIKVEKKNTNPFSLNNILDSFLGFIEKTVMMFRNMSLKQIMGCLVTMFILALILLLMYIPFNIIGDGLETLFYSIGINSLTQFLTIIFKLVLLIIFIALYILILIYIFKVAYLDRYEFVKKDAIKIEDVKVSQTEPTKEIIVEHKSPHENFLFKFLGGMTLGFIKFLLACFMIPILIFIIICCFLLVIDLYFIYNGIIFIGILLLILFSLVACLWVIGFISIFIFNRKFSFRKMFISFMCILIGIGLSIGISTIDLTRIDYIEGLPKNSIIKVKNFEKEFEMNANLALSANLYWSNLKYEIDESLTDKVIISTSFYEDINSIDIVKNNDQIIFIHRYLNEYSSLKKVWKEVLVNLRNYKIYDYDDYNCSEIVIKSSESNITKIKENTQKLEERNDYGEYYADLGDRFIRTYEVLNIAESNEEEYLYLTLRAFMGEEVSTVKVDRYLANNVAVQEWYEFTLEKFKVIEDEESIQELFKKCILKRIAKTELRGVDQINEDIP